MIWERRADMVSAIGGAFVVGWISCSGFYSIPHLWSKQDQLVAVETKEIPKLKTDLKQAHCDRDKMKDLAVRGVVAGETDNIAAPDWSDLKPCPQVAPVKAPPVSAIVKK